MADNEELRQAWDFVEHTGKSIFLTGKAGTGKTTFLHRIVNESTKRTVVVAPTGVAAINAGGVTIHSFFQLPFSPFIPNAKIKSKFDFGKEKRRIIRTLDLLIIDEISMVRSDLLDAIDSVLRRYREPGRPFGGVQLVMIGDLQQLTPVVTAEDESILRGHYDTPYFFGSHALQQIDYVTIELKTVYRQQDEAFIRILNSVRSGRPPQTVIEQLNNRYRKDFRPDPKEGYIRLTTHNHLADNYNDKELEQLAGNPQTFTAEISGTFPEYAYPTAVTLELKVGAQVMFVKNDTAAERRYYNGRIGHVTHIGDDEVFVRCPGDDRDICVTPQEWENAKYILNKETREIETDVQGIFRQLPLRLAWAITIHKSQGLTFERAIIDAALSFASGQVYVALSRCKTLEGLVLASPVSTAAVISDQRVEQYISYQEQEALQSIGRLHTLKEEYHRELLIELFDFREISMTEERLSRLLIEHFTRSHPALTNKHKATVQYLKDELSIVALKWTMLIQKTEQERLHEQPFMKRIKRSAVYFSNELEKVFKGLFTLTKLIETKNKDVRGRLADCLADAQQAVVAKRLLLNDIAEQGFSVPFYLKAKQQAILDALDGGTSKKRRNRENKVEKQKPQKESTQEKTLHMYRKGMSPAQISKERKLTLQTVINHLAKFIGGNELSLDELVEPKKQKIIRSIAQRIGLENGKKAIKELCPADITYTDITLTLARNDE
ncbi:MAG: helix-turn-helix domain-containing protein [Prevotella sp.]|nr:helix-turn-helix domain-containing protein [Prevotella sp.]